MVDGLDPVFQNRKDAGKWLSQKLKRYKGVKNVIVLAFSMGGVPVAFEIAKALHAPLDLYGVKLNLREIEKHIVILVDDGLATATKIKAAAQAFKKMNPAKLIIAVPVASRSTCAELRPEVDVVVCGVTPEPFYGVGYWYEDFSQTTDEEVQEILKLSKRKKAGQDVDL